MKRFTLLVLCLLSFIFISCGVIKNTNPQQNIDYSIAFKLQSMDKNLSDETLKAMSVILRNNLTIKQDNTNYNKPDEKYLRIVKLTKNKTLKDKNNDLIEISFDDTDNYEWQKNLKKSDILEFALKHNLSLTSLADIKPITENEKVIGLNIGNKYFDYSTLADYFKLSSNNITDIYSNKSEIIIRGYGKGFHKHFDLKKAEELSNNNHNFEEILNYFFNDLTLN